MRALVPLFVLAALAVPSLAAPPSADAALALALALQQAEAKPDPVPVKASPCSPACVCGCNASLPCTCGNEVRQAAPVQIEAAPEYEGRRFFVRPRRGSGRSSGGGSC